jgi:phosphate acetyltransferase
MSDLFTKFIEQAKKVKGTIIFAEGDEERTIQAAFRLKKDGVCDVILVGEKAAVEQAAKKVNTDVSGLKILKPSVEELDKTVLSGYIKARAKKGISEEDAKKLALEPLNFSALYVSSKKANGCVAGARSDTADLLRAAIHGIGTHDDVRLISSFFIMVPPDGHKLIKKPIFFADCAVNPQPGAVALRDIGVSSVNNFRRFFPDETARVVFLSFSTKGSSDNKALAMIKDAVKDTKEFFSKDKAVLVDGEMQFDAAVVKEVGKRKAPGSEVAGEANIFIFPDLNSGNICYKATERLAGFQAIGPIVQGLKYPMNDLSRGCSVDDIYYVAVITLLQ